MKHKLQHHISHNHTKSITTTLIKHKQPYQLKLKEGCHKRLSSFNPHKFSQH